MMMPRALTSTCGSLQDVQANSGQRVLLLGIYRAVALHQGAKPPDAPKVRAIVHLKDGTEVLLEPNWSQVSQRSVEEIREFDGQEVEVEGVIHAHSPRPVQPVAFIVGPCLSPVLSIRRHPVGGAP